MILYNETIILEEDIHDEWLAWMNSKHIGDVMATGCFVSSQVLKVLDSPNEGITYCIQYTADTIEKYSAYKEKYAGQIQNNAPEKFRNKFVEFSTVMEFKGNQ